jgi:hypothetical protein
MMKMFMIAVILGIGLFIQSCAAFYSCGTGGPVPQHYQQTAPEANKAEPTSINK